MKFKRCLCNTNKNIIQKHYMPFLLVLAKAKRLPRPGGSCVPMGCVQVSSAMREAVAGLLGGMPRDVGIVYKTSSDKLGSLAGMLMMTGYLFRNAEYVVTLQQLLNIKSRSLDEYKRVFDEIDQDGSGFIEVSL